MLGGYIRVPGPHGELTDGGPLTPLVYATLVIQYDGVVPTDRPDVDAKIRAGLRDAGVDAVVVGPMPHHDAEVAMFSRVIGHPPQPQGDVDVYWDVGAALQRPA